MKKYLFFLYLLVVTFFTEAQNIGIGTTAPQAKLHIISTGNEVLRLDADNPFLSLYSAGVYQGYFRKNINGIEIGSAAGTYLPITFAPNGNLLMYIGTNGNVGIGNNAPGLPLSFSGNLGDKISLWGNAASCYGLGVQAGLLQIHTSGLTDKIVFGYGNSSSFIERMRINNAGDMGMELNGRMLMRNGTLPLNNNYGPGIWLNKADNSDVLGFIGTENNQNLGFYGGPAGWGFTYDAVNSRVGIGTSSPAAKLHVSAGDESLALFGPNAYNGRLYVGAAAGNLGVASTAQVIVTDGNLHIDPAPGKNIYVGYFQPRDIILNPVAGNVGINTTVPGATLEVNGYTKLGNNAPSIKVKKITGTSPAMEGVAIVIAHGLSPSKILSVSVLVEAFPDFLVGPNSGANGCNFSWTLQTNHVYFFNIPGASASLLSKPVTILITYEE